MKKVRYWVLYTACLLFLTAPAMAHFGMVIPSDQMVMPGENTDIDIALMFWHPFEGIGMDLDKPVRFQVVVNGQPQNLLETLKPASNGNHKVWKTAYKIHRPGVYMFFMEPQPYWEPTEDCFIVHFTKAVVTAFGDDDGWDREIGLKTEIVPLVKPYGLYAGNLFQGIVKLDGRPVPYAQVEVEHYNSSGQYLAPTEYMITQAVKADQNGVFSYAAPKAGWWGFSALNEADFKLKHNGEEKDVEIGAVIWVKFENWQAK